MNTNYLNERNNEYVILLDEVGVYYTNSFREIVDEYKLKKYAKKENERLEAQRHSENTKEE